MLTSFILLGLGLLFILSEFFVPGAVMGVIGTLFVIASFFIFAKEESLPATILYFFFIIAALIFLIRSALWKIKRSKNGLYASGDQEGYTASEFDAALVGRIGTVLSDLKPGGYIEIDGRQLQALSQSGYVVKGKEVLVIGGDGESLIVEEKE